MITVRVVLRWKSLLLALALPKGLSRKKGLIALLQLIEGAKSRLLLVTSYENSAFSRPEMIVAVSSAAKRGVDVSLVAGSNAGDKCKQAYAFLGSAVQILKRPVLLQYAVADGRDVRYLGRGNKNDFCLDAPSSAELLEDFTRRTLLSSSSGSANSR